MLCPAITGVYGDKIKTLHGREELRGFVDATFARLKNRILVARAVGLNSPRELKQLAKFLECRDFKWYDGTDLLEGPQEVRISAGSNIWTNAECSGAFCSVGVS